MIEAIGQTDATVDFELDGQLFTGISGGPGIPFTEAQSRPIDCADQTEIGRRWEALLARPRRVAEYQPPYGRVMISSRWSSLLAK